MIENSNDVNDARIIKNIDDPAEKQDAFRQEAARYDEYAERFFKPIYPFVAGKALERTGINSGNLLDVGCSGGYLGIAVMELGDFYGTFFDINPEALKFAERRLRDHGFRGETVSGDVQNMPFPDDSFDLIVSRGSMPFWEDQRKSFQEITRVLAPGGKTYVGVGYGSSELREQSHAEMRKAQGVNVKKHNRPRNSCMYEENEPYKEIFEELGVKYTIFSSGEEGRWFMLEKQTSR
jgi:ubiquinone/menaquinone biosynthesis C-methylase UbiE